MNKSTLPFIVILLIITAHCAFSQQKKGAYKPTKYDSVKKVIPPQYYGKAREQQKADSIAKEILRQQELERMQKEALEKKLAEQARMDSLKKQKKTLPVEKGNKLQKANTAAAKVSPISEKAKVIPKPVEQNKKSLAKIDKSKSGAWTLADCISYAKLNNLKIASTNINQHYAQLLYEESKNSRYPNLNADAQMGKAFGRNIDPATNQFVNQNFNYNTVGIYSETLLFGWFQKSHAVEKNKLDMNAASYESEQLQDDISLDILCSYLRVLQAKELLKLKEQVVQSTKWQLENQVKMNPVSKALPLQWSAVLARDSAQWMEAKSNERIALLQLKALLNLDFEDPFEISTAEQDAGQWGDLMRVPDPKSLYEEALLSRGIIQYQNLKLLSAKKSLDIAKASQYPSLTLFGGLGSVYSSTVKNITGQTYQGQSLAGYVNIEGSSYPLTTSQYNYTTQTRSLGDQYGDHVRANIGLGLHFPLLNAYKLRADIQRAKIALVGQQIVMDIEKLKLKELIYTTFEEAKLAAQKYTAYKNASEESRRFLETILADKSMDKEIWYDVKRAKEDVELDQVMRIRAKYELQLKLKNLDYFVGKPLKL